MSIDTGQWQARLLQLKASLEGVEESARQGSETVELDQSRVGRLSRMDAMQMQAMSKASDARRAVVQRRIAHALQRIDDDEFGLCLSCGEDIAEGRLEADPTVTLCIDCASRAEEQAE